MKPFKYLLCLICCTTLMLHQTFAADTAIKDRLTTTIDSKPIDPNDLKMLADECLRANARDTVPLLLKGFDQLIQQPVPKGSYAPTWQMAGIVAAICELGGNEAYQSVVTRFAAAPPNSPIQKGCAITLLSYGCQFEITKALQNGNKPELIFPEVDEKLPKHLQKSAPELQDAWHYYRRVSAPYRESVNNPKTASIAVQQNWGPFYSVIEDTLVGNKTNVSACVDSFQWGGWCGTGSDQLRAPKSRAIVLGLLADDKYAQSIGAVLDLTTSTMMLARNASLDAEFAWKRQWIDFCGLDWERLFLGKALEGWPRDLLRPLAVYGTEASAKRLVALATGPQQYEHSLAQQLPILAIMVQPKKSPATNTADPNQITSFAVGIRHPKERAANAPQISLETETMILDLLHSHANEKSDPHQLRPLVDELARLKRTESISALRRVAAMPYYDVAKTAAQALQSMGEDIPMPKPPTAGRFQFLSDGKPIPNTQLGYRTARGAGSSMSSGGTTATNGVISISGSWFANPRVDASTMYFTSRAIKTTNDIVFAIDVPVPTDRSQTIAVPIITHPLRLILKNAQPSKKVSITLQYRGPIEKPEGYRSYYGVGGEITIPHHEIVTFPRLGEGRYVLCVKTHGRALWQSEEIIVNDQREGIADLQPGASVNFTLVAPGDEQADKQVQHKLLGLPANKRHNYYDYKTQSYHNLPIGEYTLKILSSAEKRNSQPRSTNSPEQPHPDCVPGDYSGREINFSITEDTPVIDLGRIELQFIQ